jgi:two-component sensor histidine kinase
MWRGRSKESWVALGGGLGAILFGLLGLVGWVFGVTALTRVELHYKAIAPSVAIALVGLGLLEVLHTRRRLGSAGRRVATVLTAAFATLGLLEVGSALTRLDLNGEDALTDYLARLTGIPFEPMSPVAGGLMLLTSLGLLLLVGEGGRPERQYRLRVAAAVLGTVSALIALSFAGSYLYLQPFLAGVKAGWLPIAVMAVAGMLCLALGLIAAAGREAWPVSTFLGSSTRAQLLRAFVPLIALAVLATSVVEMLQARLHLNHALIASLATVVCALAAALVASRTAHVLGDALDQAQLAREEAERARAEIAERMTAEINHRMKNNLMLLAGVLQLQLSSLEETAPAAGALRDAVTRVTALSVVHEQLYEGKSGDVEVRDLMTRLSQVAADTFTAKPVDYRVEGEPCYVSPKMGATIAVIVNELVTNAIKHGAPENGGRLRLELGVKRETAGLRLRVWNSGNPIPLGFRMEEAPGMGLRLVQGVVVAQLEGRFSLRPEGGGTQAEAVLGPAVLERAAGVAET